MSIKPMGTRVIVLKEKEEERVSSGGIVIPQSSIFDRVIRGRVMAQGDGVEGSFVGKTVCIPQYAGVSFEEGRDEYLIVEVGDLLGVEE